MKVLVTGAGALLGQGIIRALRASALQPYVVAVDPNPLSAGLYWADASRLIPRVDAPDYLPRLHDILAAERPDLVLVGTDLELPLFARQREVLERRFGTRVLVSCPRVVDIADDKWLTYRFVKDNGFDYPASCLPGDEEALVEEVGFPLVVKPRVSARSIGMRVVHDRTQLRQALEQGQNTIIQECVGTPEQEYTAGTLTFDGICSASIVMRRELRDGNTYRAFVDDFPDINRVVRALAEKLQPFGPTNFQFRLERGKVKVFEINARFSGTTPLRTLAGFNEVDMCARRLLRNEPVVQPALKRLVILRHWSETVVAAEDLLTEPGM